MECASQPCQNGACIEDINGYQCNCTRGYTGETSMKERGQLERSDVKKDDIVI